MQYYFPGDCPISIPTISASSPTSSPSPWVSLKHVKALNMPANLYMMRAMSQSTSGTTGLQFNMNHATYTHKTTITIARARHGAISSDGHTCALPALTTERPDTLPGTRGVGVARARHAPIHASSVACGAVDKVEREVVRHLTPNKQECTCVEWCDRGESEGPRASGVLSEASQQP
jgi:hypothetical protein